jgi:hypothetical protein
MASAYVISFSGMCASRAWIQGSFTVCWRCMHRRGKPDLIGQSKANNPRGNSYANTPFWNGRFTHLDVEYFHAMCVYYGRSII